MDEIHSLHFIGSKAFGGAERWFQRFTHALAVTGHPTELLVRKGYELDTDCWNGLNYYALPMRTVWDPLSRLEVSLAIKRHKPHIVQSYMGRATRLTRLCGSSDPVHIARLGGYYKLDGYRHAHAWVCNTQGLCDYLISNGFPSDRVFCIHNFIDPPAPSAPDKGLRESLGISEAAYILLTPGRFVPVKGHRYLIEALSRLPTEIGGRPLQLLMLGDGVLGDALRQQALQSGVAARITWAGWQSDPEPYYRLADLVVFPSLENETFGNVVIEAWALRKPLVVTAFKGARELVHHEEDALRLPCEDPVALADGINRLLSEPDLAASLAENGWRRVTTTFSRRKIMGQYLDLYHRLLEPRKRS